MGTRKERQAFQSYWIIALLFFMGVSAIDALGAEASSWPYANETEDERADRMDWWHQARFGMFIHWGVYAVPAGTYEGKPIGGIGEWIMHHGKIPVARYKKYASQFNPVKYDPDAWVKLAKEAGMKYIVITSKHHDGFALFDSKVTDWDIVDATPYGKDLLKPLAEACRKHKIKLGFYYSQAQDWNHPGGAAAGGHWDPAQDGDMTEYIKKIAVPQVKEILTNYGDIAVLWWDTPTGMTRERADLLQPLITLQPGIITNNRLGGGYPGDTETPEQHIPAMGYKDRDWETCMTMNDTWGFKSYDHNWKSTKMLIQNLVDIASKGGNYLLNVGPTAEGEIPAPSIERLKEIGRWMDVNGESIYETSASCFVKLPWGRCTKKVSKRGATLYLHVFDWPEDGKLLVPGLKNEVRKAYLLANNKELKAISGKGGVMLTVPEKSLDQIDTVVVVQVKGPIDIEKVLPKQDDSGVVTLLPFAANLHNHFGASTQVEEKGGKMNIGHWTSSRVKVDWEFEINQPGTFEIFADVAVAADKTRLNIQLGEQSLDVTIQSTGNYETFEKRSLGKMALDQAGEYKIEFAPNNEQWQPLNIRTVRLVPIK